MTLANKITIARISIIPIMILMVSIPSLNKPENAIMLQMTIGQFIFAILFIVAAATDFLDGYLARSRNEITTFGKFLDPIADKILVLTALVFMTRFPYWKDLNYDYNLYILIGILIIVIREFVITGVRLIAVDKGVVISASPLGKAKTFATMIAIIIMLFNGFNIISNIGDGKIFDYISMGAFWIALVLTILSGIDYIIRNRAIILESI